MKKSLFFCFLLICMAFDVSARELSIESFEALPTDLTARTNPINDLNGNKCALIKVSLPKEGARFLGNVLKEEFFVNEYRVYMSQGTKDLQVMCPGVEPLMVDLRPYTEGHGLESGMTYRLKLSGYDDPTAGNSSSRNIVQGNYLMLDITPKTGVVEIDGNITETDNGKLATFLSFGPHEILVRAPGYSPYSETITITAKEKTVKNIQLESIQAQLIVKPATPAATIKINGQIRATGTFSEPLAPGSYLIEVEKEGYRPYAETIELGQKEKRTIEIPALEPIYANLDIAYEPYGATITIDGKTVGTTPEVVRDILVGPHSVSITMEGYEPYSGTVNLQEDQPARLAGTLKKDDHKINGHEFVDLGLSVKWATCNVGAEKPSDYGNYYAWGETKPKSTYTKSNSVTEGKSMSDIGGTHYDVAHAEWGSRWRLPTKEECQELIDKCNWVWTSVDGHEGFNVTGPNGFSIFLPAAGWRDGDSASGVGSKGYYWSSTPYSPYDYGASTLVLDDGGRRMYITNRDYGRSVRPVSE